MKNVLIVEDHADIRRLIRMTLEFEDCEIHEAGDAAEGLEKARKLSPDLMFLDVMMPGERNGLDLCRDVKSDPLLRGIKVLLLSARGNTADREAGLQAGADAYVVKPFSPMELLALLNAEVA
ncbi:response regulator transcription factor [Pseudorhodoferax sp. Leaf265]|jgi:DNA-binding response OmpR family regulator|uniref:response regulator transcription factor n=1 Tax=Pseudorhodoferax sp. Leaf265 TaxID=1736315 RepID=UPI0006F46761|nr:response regulator [Pseudorhodoferax sp. Leaf265]KQP04238.1 two-component system response regulator [Pseudorhodoferax sp. Leaf265]